MQGLSGLSNTIFLSTHLLYRLSIVIDLWAEIYSIMLTVLPRTVFNCPFLLCRVLLPEASTHTGIGFITLVIPCKTRAKSVKQSAKLYEKEKILETVQIHRLLVLPWISKMTGLPREVPVNSSQFPVAHSNKYVTVNTVEDINKYCNTIILQCERRIIVAGDTIEQWYVQLCWIYTD